MRSLDLDYRRNGHRWPFWAGIAALLLALAALLLSGFYAQRLASQVNMLQVMVGERERALHAAPASAAQAAQSAAGGELAHAQAVVRQLTLPWNRLLATLETAQRNDIALLAVAPDAVRGQVTLSGEARDRTALFGYIRTLQAGGEFRGVHLRDYQVDERQAEQPLRFTLEATWHAR